MKFENKYFGNIIIYFVFVSWFHSCSLIPFYFSKPGSAKDTGKNGVVIIGEVRVRDSTGASFVNDIFRESLQFNLLAEGYSPIVIDDEMKEFTPFKNFGFVQIEEDSKDKSKSNPLGSGMTENSHDNSVRILGKTEQNLRSFQDKIKFDYYIDSTVILKEIGSVLDGKNSLLIFIRTYDKFGKRIGEVEYITVGPKDKLDRMISESVKEISKKWKGLTGQ
ncbi:hypothetical protein DLM76_18205 [Leptospira yasudae]|uniref:lipoprotein n=1 Tax=Leptospira yasudae TaxID=2202201 RepID=UPI000E599DFB|nr:lipoprotein [Leptospira yasudae]RHX91640.1 hypothetical protein DLM76_18205 [Leptospira yasudae]